MTMTSIFNQLPILEFHPSAKTHLEERDENHADIEAADTQSFGSSQSDGWDVSNSAPANGTVTTTNIIRSRNKNRSISPTQTTTTSGNSTTGSIDDMERLPFLHHQDSSDSDDSHFNSSPGHEATNSSSNNSASISLFTPGTSCYLQWVKLLTLAGILTTFLYLSPSFFLEYNYFPAHGRTFPGGLKSITSTPIFNYEPTTISEEDQQEEERVHIPRIVHVTYKSREELPEEWELSLQTWEKIHPNWEIRFWSDKDIEEFVHQEFPEYEALHKSYKYMIQRVDSVRYMILHHFGGVYSDMDIYPAVALDKLLQQWEDAGKNVLLAETSNMGVTNAFMASAPGSSFMGCVVENLPHYQHQLSHLLRWRHWEVLSSAGSTYLWGMVGHCPDDGVEILAARSFRGCSVCDAWETGRPAETCDTEWLRHSSTNSSWHEHNNWFHSFLVFFTYSFLCEPFRACFLTVTLFLVVTHKRRNRKAERFDVTK